MKKLLLILPLTLILFFMFGCQDKEAMAELDALKAQAELEEQNKEFVLHFYEEIDKQNFEAAIGMLAPMQVGSQMPDERGFPPFKFGTEVKSSSVIARRERDFFEYSN